MLELEQDWLIELTEHTDKVAYLIGKIILVICSIHYAQSTVNCISIGGPISRCWMGRMYAKEPAFPGEPVYPGSTCYSQNLSIFSSLDILR